MSAKYKIVIKLEITHPLEKWQNLKTGHEMGQDICEMICDEVSACGGVATYDIIKSTLDVK